MTSVKNIENGHVCGWCLIAGIHVLTVAHCIVYYKKILHPKYDGIYVVVGTHNISEEGLWRNIKHLDCSEEFYWPNGEDIIGDIGLITVSSTQCYINSKKCLIESTKFFLVWP